MKKIIVLLLLSLSFSAQALTVYEQNNFALDVYGNASLQVAMYGKYGTTNGKVTNNFDAKIEDNDSKIGLKLALSNEAKSFNGFTDLAFKIRSPKKNYGIFLDRAILGVSFKTFGTASVGFMSDIISEYILDDMQVGYSYQLTRMTSSAYINNQKNEAQRTGQFRYDSPLIFGLKFSAAAQIQPKSWGAYDKTGKAANTFAYQIGASYFYKFSALNGKVFLAFALDSNGNDTLHKVGTTYYKNFSYGFILGYSSDYFGMALNYQGYAKHKSREDLNNSIALSAYYNVIEGLKIYASTNILLFNKPSVYALNQDASSAPKIKVAPEYSFGISYAMLDGFYIYGELYSKLVPEPDYITSTSKPYMPMGAAFGLKFEF